LESLLFAFIQPNGAMRSTQHPHLVDFRGVIGLSSQIVPAPTISPLNERYTEQLAEIAV
jgi:CRISPR-associated protein Cst2